MRDFNELKSRSFISLRNQRGYGTQKKTGWQWENPFPEIDSSSKLKTDSDSLKQLLL